MRDSIGSLELQADSPNNTRLCGDGNILIFQHSGAYSSNSTAESQSALLSSSAVALSLKKSPSRAQFTYAVARRDSPQTLSESMHQ